MSDFSSRPFDHLRSMLSPESIRKGCLSAGRRSWRGSRRLVSKTALSRPRSRRRFAPPHWRLRHSRVSRPPARGAAKTRKRPALCESRYANPPRRPREPPVPDPGRKPESKLLPCVLPLVRSRPPRPPMKGFLYRKGRCAAMRGARLSEIPFPALS